MAKNLGAKTREGVVWTSFFNFARYSVRIVSSIILARILFPEDFGVWSLALVAVHFADRIASFGFTMVLVQRNEIKREHYDTVFTINFILMSAITTILFIGAPYIAAFFNNDHVRPVLMVISFEFIIKAFFSVPNADLTRRMKYKRLGIINIVSGFISLLSPIPFALFGFGVWSLVFGELLGAISANLLLVYHAHWFPRFRFYRWAFKDVFPFGMWVNVNNYIRYFIENVDYILIGKFLNATQLGFYERAFNLMTLPKKRIQRTISNVLFSTYSRMQDDEIRLINALLRVVSYVTTIAYPIMIWMFFAAPSLITVFYGPKWTSTIYPLQVMCISGLLGILTAMFNPVLTAKGLVSKNAFRNFISLLFLAAAVYIGIPWGINGVAWGVALASMIPLSLNLFLTKKYLPFTLRQFIMAQKSAIIYGMIQIGALLLITSLIHPYVTETSMLMFGLVTIISAISLVVSHLIFRFNEVNEFLQEFTEIIKRFGRILSILNRLNIIKQSITRKIS